MSPAQRPLTDSPSSSNDEYIPLSQGSDEKKRSAHCCLKPNLSSLTYHDRVRLVVYRLNFFSTIDRITIDLAALDPVYFWLLFSTYITVVAVPSAIVQRLLVRIRGAETYRLFLPLDETKMARGVEVIRIRSGVRVGTREGLWLQTGAGRPHTRPCAVCSAQFRA